MLRILLLSTLFIVFQYRTNAQSIKIGTFLIPQYVQNESKGEFIELALTIAKKHNIPINIEVLPAKRTISHFEQKLLLGYFPALKALNNIPTYDTIPFYYKKDFLFHLTGNDIDLERENKICLTSGYPYSKDILVKDHLEFVYANSDEACLEMLHLKRVDGFICEAMTGIIAIEKNKNYKISVSPGAISNKAAYFSFQRNEMGKKLSQIYSSEIRALRNSGKLKRTFSNQARKIQKYIELYDPTNK